MALPRYESLAADDNEDDSEYGGEEKHVVTGNTTSITTIAIIILLSAILATLLFISLVVLYQKSDRACTRRLSVYSPAVEAVEYVDTTLQNKFDEPSIYRGPPTPESEKAWHDLYRFGVFELPMNALRLLNKSDTPERQYERMTSESDSGYRATLDVLHQLHCLNTVRQYTWLLMDGYGPNSPRGLEVPHSLRSSEAGNRMHADHCLETLRKVIMCHGDITPLLDIVDPQNVVGGGRSADFNIYTKCRDFGKIQEWLKKQVKIPFIEGVTDSP